MGEGGWSDECVLFCFYGGVDCGWMRRSVVVYLAGEPERSPMSLWVYFVHGLLLGLLLAWLGSLFGKQK